MLFCPFSLFSVIILPSWVLPYSLLYLSSIFCRPLNIGLQWCWDFRGKWANPLPPPFPFFSSLLSFFRACPVVGKHQDFLLFPPASSSSFSCSLILRFMDTPCQLMEWCDVAPLLKWMQRWTKPWIVRTFGYVKLIQKSKQQTWMYM